MGYHKRQITKGVFGEISKIQEEVEELLDAEEQQVKIMIHVELSDLYGAVRGYAAKHGLSMKDLEMMSDRTASAFADGIRKES